MLAIKWKREGMVTAGITIHGATTMTCGNQLECSDPTTNCNNRREGTTKTIEWIPMDYHDGCWSMEASSLSKNINSPYETMVATMTTSATINSTERTRQCPKQQSTAAALRKRDAMCPWLFRLVSPAFPPAPKQQPHEVENNNQLHGG